MSCGKPSEEIIGRSVEGNEEVLTVRKICHHNPAEDFETMSEIIEQKFKLCGVC